MISVIPWLSVTERFQEAFNSTNSLLSSPPFMVDVICNLHEQKRGGMQGRGFEAGSRSPTLHRSSTTVFYSSDRVAIAHQLSFS
jgi:hypothetical protein